MSRKQTIPEIIERANKKHNHFYDYSKIKKFDGMKTYVTIICPIHGGFPQTMHDHIYKKSGCRFCGSIRRAKSKTKSSKQFEKEANTVHNGIYTYHNDYVCVNGEVRITCRIHEDFFQTPNSHINLGQGCPDCKNKKSLPFDFYLPERNICIEFQGIQHYEPREFFGGEKTFKERKFLDNIKREYCKDNNIKLLEISYKDFKNIEDILLTINN